MPPFRSLSGFWFTPSLIINIFTSSKASIMAEHDIEKSFMYWAGLASRMFSVYFNNELSGTGLTYRQAQVLICLDVLGDLAQTELAAQLEIEPPTLVRILDRMEKAGLIRRLPSPKDRRKKIIRALKKQFPSVSYYSNRGAHRKTGG